MDRCLAKIARRALGGYVGDTGTVVPFIAEEFGRWLFDQFADAAKKKLVETLFGSEQEQALHRVAWDAIQDTAGEFGWPDRSDAGQLAMIINHVFHEPLKDASLTTATTMLEELHRGVSRQLTVLDDASLTGIGRSSADLLGVSGTVLAESLYGNLVRRIVVRGSAGGPLAALANQFNHELTRFQDHADHELTRQLVQRLEAAIARLGDGERAAQQQLETGSTPGLLLNQVHDPFALGVHRPFQLDVRKAEPVRLPVYVSRQHDADLSDVVQAAVAGKSGIAVLAGGSSTGKTRACWEALTPLRGRPEVWRVWHPLAPSYAEAVLDGLPTVAPYTVLWLNETQRYLDGPLGEQVAAGLRELLRDPARGPILVLGALWQEDWAALTTNGSTADKQDSHSNARALLAGADIEVPESFTGPALDAVRAAAADDPYLTAAAERTGDGRITQYIAGVPALLERYRTAPALPKALMHAAMELVLLGHSPILPVQLLSVAAPAYLTDLEWEQVAPNWPERLGEGLDYAAVPCKGIRGPLSPVIPRPGQPGQEHPSYRLADYLAQQARRGIVGTSTSSPTTLWDALVEHAATADLLSVERGARARALERHAMLLCRRAAAAGQVEAFGEGVRVLSECGRVDEALVWCERALEAGNVFAFKIGARLLSRAGRLDEASDWLARAAEAGDAEAMHDTAVRQEKEGRPGEALVWYERAAEAGNTKAMTLLPTRLMEAIRVDDAIAWYQRLVESGFGPHMSAARALEGAGRIEDAIVWYQRAADAGVVHAPADIARLRGVDQGNDLLAWLQERAEAGDGSAAQYLAELLVREDRIEEAVACWRQAVEVGHVGISGAAPLVIPMLKRLGRTDEVIEWCQRVAVATGAAYKFWDAIAELRAAGRLRENIPWIQDLAEDGNSEAMISLAQISMEDGRIDDAWTWYLRACKAGSEHVAYRATESFRRSGFPDRALAWCEAAADMGSYDAMEMAADIRLKAGQIDEAISWLDRAVRVKPYNVYYSDDDGDVWESNLTAAANKLRAAGREADAVAWLRGRAEMGDRQSLELAVKILKDGGREQEAIAWLDGCAGEIELNALMTAGELRENAGSIDEALQCYKRAAESGYWAAARAAVRLYKDAGQVEEAFTWYERLISQGRIDDLMTGAELLGQLGRVNDAIAWYMRASISGDARKEHVARLLRSAGRSEEAVRLLRWGWEPDETIASPWEVPPPEVNRPAPPA